MPFRARIYLLLTFECNERNRKMVGEAAVCTFSANQTYGF